MYLCMWVFRFLPASDGEFDGIWLNDFNGELYSSFLLRFDKSTRVIVMSMKFLLTTVLGLLTVFRYGLSGSLLMITCSRLFDSFELLTALLASLSSEIFFSLNSSFWKIALISSLEVSLFSWSVVLSKFLFEVALLVSAIKFTHRLARDRLRLKFNLGWSSSFSLMTVMGDSSGMWRISKQLVVGNMK